LNVAIVYTSKHGTTAEVAGRIAQALAEQGVGDARLIDLGKTPQPDLSSFDAVVVGGPVYRGQPVKQLKTFLTAQADSLRVKPLALFVCGMEDDPAKLESAIAASFDESLRSHACGVWHAGGAFRFDKMGFMAKAIIKKVANTTQSVSKLNDDVPNQIAAAIKAAL